MSCQPSTKQNKTNPLQYPSSKWQKKVSWLLQAKFPHMVEVKTAADPPEGKHASCQIFTKSNL